ncbi:hypothetical protein FRC08_000169 [Ceratobasidium sp. 394]|nr:hypothetical protein FRC08_000169 [Ceratobasidium sp. 394]
MDTQQLAAALVANPQLLARALALATVNNVNQNQPPEATPPAVPGRNAGPPRSPTVGCPLSLTSGAGGTHRGRTLQHPTPSSSDRARPSSSNRPQTYLGDPMVVPRLVPTPVPLHLLRHAAAAAPTLRRTTTTIPVAAAPVLVLVLARVTALAALVPGPVVVTSLGPKIVTDVLVPRPSPGPTAGHWLTSNVSTTTSGPRHTNSGQGKRRTSQIMVGGEEKIFVTPVERLKTRQAKFEHFKLYTHPFAKAHHVAYFNPYSYRRSDLRNYKRVGRPTEFQLGRRSSKPMHELIGFSLTIMDI